MRELRNSCYIWLMMLLVSSMAKAVVSPPLTREEGKLITRRRLSNRPRGCSPRAASPGPRASAVARAAGVAQPTFYVHFRDMDDLLKTIGEEKIGALRTALRAARERVRRGRGRRGDPRDVHAAAPHPGRGAGIFRVYLQQFHAPASPLGEQARRLREELRRDLTEDLAGLGMPAGTPTEREQLEMIAEAMIAQTEALGLAYLDGRY